MTSSSCLTCAHSAIRDRSNEKRDATLRFFNRLSMVNCTKSPGRATFYPLTHLCEAFEAGEAEFIVARVKWAAKLEIR